MDVLEYRKNGVEDGVEEVYSKSVRQGAAPISSM